MPRSVTAAFRQALMAERTGDVIATLLTIASRDRYEAAVLKSKPVGYWRLGEIAGQTVAWDIGGNGLHGTYAGGITLQQDVGMLDGDPAVLFDGATTSRVTVPHNTLLNLGPAFSVAALFKRGTGTPPDAIAAKYAVGSNTGWILYYDGTNLVFELAGVTLRSTPWPGDGVLHRVLVTQSNNVMKLSVNGVLKVTDTSGSPINTTTDLMIGTRDPTFMGWPGYIKDLAIYARALTEAEDADHQAALAKTTIPTIRVTDHKPDVVSRGRKYLSFPYEFIWPDDSEDSPPVARLRISNVSRTIVEGLRLVGSGHRLTVTGEMLRVAAPDVVEVAFPKLELLHATATASVIEGDLGVRLARARRYPKQRFLPSTHPGVF